MIVWSTGMPMEVSVAEATPVANGLTVEPSTPQPAPSSTMAAPTSTSVPAAIMVAASRA